MRVAVTIAVWLLSGVVFVALRHLNWLTGVENGRLEGTFDMFWVVMRHPGLIGLQPVAPVEDDPGYGDYD